MSAKPMSSVRSSFFLLPQKAVMISCLVPLSVINVLSSVQPCRRIHFCPAVQKKKNPKKHRVCVHVCFQQQHHGLKRTGRVFCSPCLCQITSSSTTMWPVSFISHSLSLSQLLLLFHTFTLILIAVSYLFLLSYPLCPHLHINIPWLLNNGRCLNIGLFCEVWSAVVLSVA